MTWLKGQAVKQIIMMLPFTMTAITYPVLHILFQPCSTVSNFHIQKGNPYISSNNISVNNVGRGFIDLATRWQNTNIQLIDDNSEQNVASSVDQHDKRPVLKVTSAESFDTTRHLSRATHSPLCNMVEDFQYQRLCPFLLHILWPQ